MLFDVGAFDARLPQLHERSARLLGSNATWWNAADPVLKWTHRTRHDMQGSEWKCRVLKVSKKSNVQKVIG